MKTEKVECSNGLSLFLRSWRPARGPRGVLVIVHGFNAHSGRYVWVGEQLAKSGLAVYAFDLRGRGQSDGERFYVEKFADYVEDLDTIVTLAKGRHPNVPVYLLGHGAGGVVAATHVLDHPAEVSGFICESIAFRLPTPDFALAVLKGLSHLAPHAHVLRLRNEAFSHDPAVVEAMNADPLIENEVQPTRTVAAMVRADQRLEEEFPRITLPLLILHGTGDEVTDPSGSELFYEKTRSDDKTMTLYDGRAHDLLNDLDKERVLADILRWIDQRTTVKAPPPRPRSHA